MAAIRRTSEAGELHAVIHQFPASRAKTADPSELEAGDRTGITSNARELNRALGVVDGASEVRTARVAALREQIANGTYAPDPRDVAREILRRGL